MNNARHNELLVSEIEHVSVTGVWEFELANKILKWTPEVSQILCLEQNAEQSFATVLSIVPKQYQKVIKNAFNRACNFGIPYRFEVVLNGASCNQKKRILTTGQPRRTAEGVITHVFGTIDDMSQCKSHTLHEQQQDQYFSSILDNLNDTVVTINQYGKILSTNTQVEATLGYVKDELLGKNVSVLMPENHAVMHDSYMSNYQKTGDAKIIGLGRELTAKKKNGDIIPIELTLSESNLNGKIIYIGIIRDITERKIAQEKIHRLAYFDEVSDLPNLHSFEADYKRLLNKAKMTNGDIYIAVLDINRLSEINLAFGLKAGNLTIHKLASRVLRQLSGDYKLYRGQGSSFILISNSPLNAHSEKIYKSISALELAIQAAINNLIDIEGNPYNLSASLSSVVISAVKSSCDNTLSLIEFMRKELKKYIGGYRVRLHDKDCQKFERHSIIKSSLLEALKANQLYIVLQPKFNSHEQVVCSEVLVRWHHPVLGNISPVEFISIAEESDDINAISMWVLNQACRLLQIAFQKGISTSMAVNLSVKDFVRPDFEKVVLDVTKLYGVSPDSLIFEITETSLMSDVGLVKRKLEYLSKTGFSFSIDDFGTGYSSLAYLSSLPVHELKIDQQFVSEINNSPDKSYPIIDNIIRLAKDLGLATVAEGVETIEQFNYLKSRQCDLYQGYFLSKPLEEKEWLTFLANNLHLQDLNHQPYHGYVLAS